MDKQELRFGNWVMNAHGRELQVTDMESTSKLRPIPLTEEWLLKLGWTRHKENGRYGYRYYYPILDYNYVVERDWQKYPSHFFGVETTDAPNPEDDYKPHHFSFDLKYVHQLMNIFHALTLKELTIK